ncbi:M15 family metallopeptidase [Coprococcus sp. AF21-14LB]|uniref:M15 family metallopeptidase n=1 Tax=Coprococcus sp. AF21-14LB TaxID=2292231 RepID=UPI001FA8A207|nr:M15 family metallopeptidase [Coprococcus sp. AF21-14LB]
MEKQKIKFGVLGKRVHRAYKRMRPAQRRKMILNTAIVIAGIAAGILSGYLLGEGLAERKADADIKAAEKKLYRIQEQLQEVNQQLEESGAVEDAALAERMKEFEDGIPWNMTLVNAENPMQEGYVPELAEVENGYSVDARIAEDLNAMLAAARADGCQPQICSAYRSVEKQVQVFNDTVNSWISQGSSFWDAYQRTTQEVALPGTSEHGIGLAVDIVSSQYAELDAKQAETMEAQWLQEHCYEYGFILRYPPEKQSLTGIIYEPWHYRYVGREMAQKIKESGLTLEEYLGKTY